VVTSKPGIGNRVVSLVSQAGNVLLHSDKLAAEVLTFLEASATKCQLELSCHSLLVRAVGSILPILQVTTNTCIIFHVAITKSKVFTHDVS